MAKQGRNKGHKLKKTNFNGSSSYARKMKAELERKAKQEAKEAERRKKKDDTK